MINWVISPAKGLLQSAAYGFLPKIFLHKNKDHVPVRILIAQAILVSFFCLTLTFVPTLNIFYWFLMALSTTLYMIMYILMFLSALKLGRPCRQSQTFRILPGIRTFFGLIGLLGALLTIIIGCFPPEEIQVKSLSLYISLIILGYVIFIAPVMILCHFKKST
jgi:amino acid transporter